MKWSGVSSVSVLAQWISSCIDSSWRPRGSLIMHCELCELCPLGSLVGSAVGIQGAAALHHPIPGSLCILSESQT